MIRQRDGHQQWPSIPHHTKQFYTLLFPLNSSNFKDSRSLKIIFTKVICNENVQNSFLQLLKIGIFSLPTIITISFGILWGIVVR